MHRKTAKEIRDDVAAGTFSAVEACRQVLDRSEALNPKLNAFNLIAADRALARAAEIDRARAAGGPLGPLAGVPVAVKDNLCVRGMRTTASSKILQNFVPPYDATAVRRHDRAVVGPVAAGQRRGVNLSHVAEPRISPRTKWQPPSASGGNMYMQWSQRTSACGAGR